MNAISFFVILSTLICFCSCNNHTIYKRPNVIFILADDLGYGDLGCYGQELISTPNIDKMAADGMLFTQYYAGSTVSAPSRCALLTGYHTGHADIRGNKELPYEGQLGMEERTMTIAEMLKAEGYTTGAFGKWGLGAPGGFGDPNNKGFDEFFGYNCQRHSHRYYPTHLWHNQDKVMLLGNDNYAKKTTFAPDQIQDKALDFIKSNSKNGKPFFAYIAIIQPHAELLAQDDELYAQYDGQFEETPYIATEKGAEYGDSEFNVMSYSSQPKPRATYATMVSQMDEYVGEIIAQVKDLGIADDTIIIFSSDNGPHLEGGADPDFFNSNGGLTGYKRSMTDGGIRVPMVAMWQGKIKAGVESDHIGAFWDIMPTLAELCGGELPEDIDGISIAPTLIGKAEQAKHEYLYWEYRGCAAVRMGDWKAIKMKDNQKESGKIQLYNIKADIAESNDVAAEYIEIVEQMSQIFDSAHIYNANFPHNIEEQKRANL